MICDPSVQVAIVATDSKSGETLTARKVATYRAK
jgi:hypothetical protein